MKNNSDSIRAGMKAWSLCAISSILLASSANAAEEAPQPDPKVFEAIGMMFAQGSGLSRMEFSNKEIDLIISGIVKGMKLKEVPPEVESLQPKIEAIMRVKMEIARKAKQSAGAKASTVNKVKGKQFLAELQQKEGVLKDPSGFLYEILKEGTGPNPTMEDTVRLHYHGTLIDGTVFDSSVERQRPASFPMRGVIKGFSGGLTKVKVGGKVRIYIPSELGYGDNPRPGGKIKPGDTLIFECELLEIM
ncbi:MAG: FKBP-type peptidyl-prolyl cis-trans isomerase [Opitutae bacterium]|nr:FKBP-type peptidyl-prolyl cis-trans isomerase [Opitutae bacterium]